MKLTRTTNDRNIIINTEQDFQTDLGWQENLVELEDEVLKDIINPVDNYETVRYIHKTYDKTISGVTLQQTDIWFNFYFLSGSTYVQNYEAIGITNRENELMLRQSTESFFRLEFFKTPWISGNTYEAPNRKNRRLVFTKNLSLPLGEKFLYTNSNSSYRIHLPIFTGSNYRNKENMYLFWFEDETVLEETNLIGTSTGNTFFMTAKFYNAKDGSIIDFNNRVMSTGDTIDERYDMYYQVDFDLTGRTYCIHTFTGGTPTFHGNCNVSSRRGNNITGTSINFFEKGGGVLLGTFTPTPTPIPTATPTATPTPTTGIGTPTPTPTSTTPLGVNSIALSSGTTVADACTGTTQTYYWTGVSFVNGVILYTDSALTTVAPGGTPIPTYFYYSSDYNTIYEIPNGDGRKYGTSELCPTPTPFTTFLGYSPDPITGGTFGVLGFDDQIDDSGYQVCNNAYGVIGGDPGELPWSFSVYGTNIEDATQMVGLNDAFRSYLSTNQIFYIRQRISGIFKFRKFQLDGDPSSSSVTATPLDVAYVCPAPITPTPI